MRVTLNEVALGALLESEQGPVGREILDRAERVVQGAQRRVAFIMADSPLNVAAEVGLEQRADGSVVIGIRDSGRITNYLAEKETRESVWLIPALAEVFPG